jgi:hypothetical protein
MPLTLHRHATANACADAGSTGESDSTPLRDYAWNVKLACRKDTNETRGRALVFTNIGRRRARLVARVLGIPLEVIHG